MTNRKLCLFALTVAGCGAEIRPDVVRRAPCLGDAEIDVPLVGALPGRTVDYVFSSFIVGETPEDEFSPQFGFNHDGIHTANDGSTPFSCGKPDQPSALDLDQNCPERTTDPATGRCNGPAGCAAGAGCRGGVDNQFPNLVDVAGTFVSQNFPDGVRPVYTQFISSRKIAIVLRVEGIDNFVDDTMVRVSVLEAFPTYREGCAGARVDERFVINALSVQGGANQPRVASAFGRIVAGRLMVSGFDGFPLPFPNLDGMGVGRLAVTGVQLRVDLSETAGRRGNFGAFVNGGEIVRYGQGMLPTLAEQIPGIVGGFVDLQAPVPNCGTEISGTCVNRMTAPPLYGNVGIGVGFDLVRIQLSNVVAMSPPPRNLDCDGTPYTPDASIDARVNGSLDATMDATLDAAQDVRSPRDAGDASVLDQITIASDIANETDTRSNE